MNEKDKEQVTKLKAMRKSFDTVKKRQKENKAKIPDLEEKRKRLRAVREKYVGDEELITKTVENLKKNGFRVAFAKDAEEAIATVVREIGDAKTIVKSKSNISKEIHLTSELGARDINVVETDIGDRLIQLLDETPSHPTGPASHLSLKYIVRALGKKCGVKLKEDPLAVIEWLRADIKAAFQEAEVGITGANSIAAEGSALILHNEGNIFETITRPKKWIILAGIDKFYPSIEESLNAARIQTFYATGAVMPSFIEIISGVSKTADIEKQLYEGVHNPKEVLVIIIDNHRRELMKNGFREMFYCIGCGNCVMHCPSYAVFGEKYKGGRFALFSSLYADESDLQLCLSCLHCKKNCPISIDIPKMISKARAGNELYNFAASHAKWVTQGLYVESLAMYFMLKDEPE